MIVKALSLWEPWASLMRCGAKTIETRSWRTAYRGPLLICAAQRWTHEQSAFCSLRPVREALAGQSLWFGNAVCLVHLTLCVPADTQLPFRPREEVFGDYSPGRWAWITTNLRTFAPFPVRGGRRLFTVEVPDSLLSVGGAAGAAHPSADVERSHVFIWKANATEQLDALVRDHVEGIK